jgi:hypothetical protein
MKFCIKILNDKITGGEDQNGRSYMKQYFLPRYYRTTHQFAKSLCRAYDMEFAYIDNLSEFKYVSSMVKENEDKFVGSGFKNWVLIDGMTLVPRSPNDWYWTVNGEKVSFEMPFMSGQPDSASADEKCLSLGPSAESSMPYKFNDYPCNRLDTTFICQKMKIIDISWNDANCNSNGCSKK